MQKRLGIFSIVLFICYLIAAGTASGDLVNTVPAGLPASGTLSLDQNWTGQAYGTLGGSSVGWETGYGFYFDSNNITYHEINSFCVSSTAAPDTFATYQIESLQTYVNGLGTGASNYEKAAWLVNQSMLGNVNPVTAQVAVWETMFNNYTFSGDSHGDTQDTINYWVTQAANNYSSFNLGDFYIATSPGYQTYVFGVPEPATILLLGSALIGIVAYRSRRREKC